MTCTKGRKSGEGGSQAGDGQRTLKRPENFTDSEYASFMRYAMEFFLDKGRLWQKHSQRVHQLVIPKKRRLNILREVHNKIGHKRFYLTREIITQQFWWPHIKADIILYLNFAHLPYLSKATNKEAINNTGCQDTHGIIF